MLPSPSPDALAHSQRLAQTIRAEIAASGGWISFARYMALALYAPGLGYYSAGASKFGAAGDFVTAPEISALFGRTLARQLAELLPACGGNILELGAGSGQLALDCLLELERLHALPQTYFILEISADLQARQRSLLRERAPHLVACVVWLDALPARFSGIVVANEVLDALPVHCVERQGDAIVERGVVAAGSGFAWAARALPAGDLHTAAMQVLPAIDGYQSELNRAAPALIGTLADTLEHGALLLIDYGFPQAEYYHPQRHMGTLRAHYRHHALDDPFYLPGLADLTAHVDFSAVAQAGVNAGLQLAGYATQAAFLLDAGITDLLMQTAPADAAAYLPQANAVQRLISPAEMGELFKVIAFGKGLDQAWRGFARGDRRHTL